MAILLNESTFTEPESHYFQQTKVWANISAEERTANFMLWFNALPILETVETAAPEQAWQSFWGAMSPVSPIRPLPPTSPRPPSIYGHLPFKATTLPETVIYRWKAYPEVRGLIGRRFPQVSPRTPMPHLLLKFLSSRLDLGLWRDLRCRISCLPVIATSFSRSQELQLNAGQWFRFTVSPAAALR